ncbi:tetratricopeptide repeat protein [Marinobacter sp. HN1S83]|uniref:tetratricopeptide repeat protein n=1 Tax=Marinobacter sp. HN1S83 TaxID=3382301 RepID=UPI00387B6B24
MSKNTLARICGLFLLLVSASSTLAESDQERSEALFREGYTLYQQRYSAVAITPLEEAANLGHPEAAYWVGEILRKRYSYMTEEAEQFYRMAAEGGEVYAMLRFAQKGKMCGTLRDCDYDREEWLDRAVEFALPKAEAGDTEAMMAVALAAGIGGDRDEGFEWVKRAAENGHAFAQYWLATGLLDQREMGFYWTEEGRREDIIKWLRTSAKQGYPPAMRKLAVKLREQGQFEEGRYWIEKMAETDHYNALVEAGVQIMMGPDIGEVMSPTISYHFEKPRPVEGAAILLAVHREKGKDEPLELIEYYQDYLTPEIMAEAKERSKELLIDTPIIYYLPKFGM